MIGPIGFPSYRNHVITSNRAAAKSFISNIAAREEQVMLDARAYQAVAATNVTLGAPINLGVPTEVAKYYNVCIAVPGVNPCVAGGCITSVPKNCTPPT